MKSCTTSPRGIEEAWQPCFGCGEPKPQWDDVYTQQRELGAGDAKKKSFKIRGGCMKRSQKAKRIILRRAKFYLSQAMVLNEPEPIITPQRKRESPAAETSDEDYDVYGIHQLQTLLTQMEGASHTMESFLGHYQHSFGAPRKRLPAAKRARAGGNRNVTSLRLQVVTLVVVQMLVIASTYNAGDSKRFLYRNGRVESAAPSYTRYIAQQPLLVFEVAFMKSRDLVTAGCGLLCLYGAWAGRGAATVPTLVVTLVNVVHDVVDTLTVAKYLSASRNLAEALPFVALSMGLSALQIDLCLSLVACYGRY